MHHIIPIDVDWSRRLDITNLELLCGECHNQGHGRISPLVGVNTSQLGQVQGFKLKYSVTVGRVQYSGEKYLYFDGSLYAVATLSKAKSAAEMLLNVEEVNDGAAKAAIEEWSNANL